MKRRYVDKKFREESLSLITMANVIIDEYKAQGFDLTLRQLYYQFVARGYIPNTMRDYKRLGSVINDGRLAGLIDWNAIVDRTRNLQSLAHWNNAPEIIDACADQFRLDKWETQKFRPQVWIEKDALLGVIAEICERYDIPYFSCRGYVSQSEMHSAAMRAIHATNNKQTPVVIHLGDHDPSGIDMTRDIKERFLLFGAFTLVKRIALNMDQVEELSPPPNPAKLTDTRSQGYIEEFGESSWELDALEPKYMEDIIEAEIKKLIDMKLWKKAIRWEKEEKRNLTAVSENWSDVISNL
jgi:hypothetical protein